jgi:hypothetical protein
VEGRVQLNLPKEIWGKKITIYGGRYYSHEGGTESRFCRRMDALLLAAHECGAQQARDSPPGLYVATAAGKEYIQMVKPFRRPPLAEWEDFESRKEAIRKQIKARMGVIYEQLLRWPHEPFEVQQ